MLISDKNLYYVGGVVRDEFLGTKSFDTDFCYEGDAIEFAKQKSLNIVKINPDFGTVRVLCENKEIDIASTRTEIYPRKGHLPKVVNIGCTLKDDLIRRDFTVNAMAKRTTDGKLIDYFGGLEDIKNKKLRILHKNSFIDDPTRIIRGLKFSVRFDFSLDEETKKLQEEYLNNINYDMSYHRLRKELVETFSLNNAEAFDQFINQKIYRLLGYNGKIPDIKGKVIKEALENYHGANLWFMYVAPFIGSDTNLPLKRSEKRILDWLQKLQTQKPVNNTPYESIILKNILY